MSASLISRSGSSAFSAIRVRGHWPTKILVEGEELQTNLLQVSQRGPASSSVLDEVFGTHSDHRALEAALQHDSTALIARLQTAGPRSSTMAGFATRASFAGHPSRSATAGHALLFNPDHLMGAGHGHDPCACGA